MTASDMEATYDCIEEAVAKESYLVWLKEHAATSGEPSGCSVGEVSTACMLFAYMLSASATKSSGVGYRDRRVIYKFNDGLSHRLLMLVYGTDYKVV